MKENKKKNIILSSYTRGLYNAGPKAKMDIEKIVSKTLEFDVVSLDITNNISNAFIRRIYLFVKRFILANKVHKNVDLASVQSPYSNRKIILNKFKKKILIIHDIDGLRQQIPKKLKKEINFYKSCDYVIVHNQRMKDFLVERGVIASKIYILELFDYLCVDRNENYKDKESENFKEPTIVYSGNLDKANFINQLDSKEMKFKINLYGTKTKEINNNKMLYKGVFNAEELPNKLEGNLGLVWDGNYDESDEYDTFKFYTKYNNPHKLSCYIAAGFPVIVWKKSAIADFVRKYNIGYEISDLYEINDLDFSDYEKKIDNLKNLTEKVRNGYFTKRVINEVLRDSKYIEN